MGHPRLAAGAAHVFVADLDAPEMTPADAHHVLRVLRVRADELVTVSDGEGGWRCCSLTAEGRLRPTTDVAREDAPHPTVTIGFALTKGDKPELTVQKLTELGVDRIVPVLAARSVVRWDQDKAAKNTARLRAVARAAAMQSRRAWLPEVADPTPLPALAGPGVALAHPGGGAVTLDAPAVVVGPEGGWTEDEAAAVPLHVDLGPTTLRAETAAIAAAVLLVSLRDQRIRSG